MGRKRCRRNFLVTSLHLKGRVASIDLRGNISAFFEKAICPESSSNETQSTKKLRVKVKRKTPDAQNGVELPHSRPTIDR
ncbi:hypothetical protein CDAR_225471 [Caerostris darwini]|uniref:Uncharacterized protein n=1 Tax=Caerostris darwini TaxID=1538125 RepID=A0AAV4QZF6_9ARAC|nr:hypothetical protein CDAR_225471 [Caerostris darwini]